MQEKLRHKKFFIKYAQKSELAQGVIIQVYSFFIVHIAQKCFCGKRVRAIVIQVGAESMAEGVAGKPALPSKPVLMGVDVS